MPTTPHSSRLPRCRFAPLLMGAAFAVLLAGCGTERVASVPYQPAPPAVSSTVPGLRETGVPYDTPISVDFAEDMDAGTFSDASVRLKLDTQRLPLLMSWDPGLRRLTLHPQARLELRRTYTVELTGEVRTAEGEGFGDSGWFFQFTTNGARRPMNPLPAPGSANESPFVTLSWDSTEAGVGGISYEIWSGPDSSAVAARAGSPTATSARARWLPTVRWPLASTIYWAITVVNGAAGERLHGPVQSFSTLPAGLAEDSLLVRGQDYGFNYLVYSVSSQYPYQFCSSDSVFSLAGTQAWMTFPLTGLPPDVRIASARLEIYTFDHYLSRLPITILTLWSSRHAWPLPCRSNIQFRESLPIQDQAVATGKQESGRRLLFVSDLLASHVEATARRGGLFGYELVASQRVAFATPRIADPALHPYLKIHYFRTVPRPVLTAAP